MLLAGLLIGTVWGVPQSIAASQTLYTIPVPMGDNTGGEEKKKDQETATTGDEASTAKDAQPATGEAAPAEKPEARPTERKVNSFNFLFEMLYHFNVLETTSVEVMENPAQGWLHSDIPLYKGQTAMVSN